MHRSVHVDESEEVPGGDPEQMPAGEAAERSHPGLGIRSRVEAMTEPELQLGAVPELDDGPIVVEAGHELGDPVEVPAQHAAAAQQVRQSPADLGTVVQCGDQLGVVGHVGGEKAELIQAQVGVR